MQTTRITPTEPAGAVEIGGWNSDDSGDDVRSYRAFADGDDCTWAYAYGLHYADGACAPLEIYLGARSDTSCRNAEECLSITVAEARRLHAQLGRVLQMVEIVPPATRKLSRYAPYVTARECCKTSMVSIRSCATID